MALLRAYQAAGQQDNALQAALWLGDHRSLAAAEWLDEYAGQTIRLNALLAPPEDATVGTSATLPEPAQDYSMPESPHEQAA